MLRRETSRQRLDVLLYTQLSRCLAQKGIEQPFESMLILLVLFLFLFFLFFEFVSFGREVSSSSNRRVISLPENATMNVNGSQHFHWSVE